MLSTNANDTTSQIQQADLLIGDEDRINAESIAWCLQAHGEIQTVEVAEVGSTIVSRVAALRPRVLLLSERFACRNIRELAELPAVRLGETRVAAFFDRMSDRQADFVLRQGLNGVLSRRDSIRVLNAYLARIASGQSVVSTHLEQRVAVTDAGEFQSLGDIALTKLTDRQWDVLRHLAAGSRVADVAKTMGISEKSVESHKYRIMRSLGMNDRVELCRWAIREGLISP